MSTTRNKPILTYKKTVEIAQVAAQKVKNSKGEATHFILQDLTISNETSPST